MMRYYVITDITINSILGIINGGITHKTKIETVKGILRRQYNNDTEETTLSNIKNLVSQLEDTTEKEIIQLCVKQLRDKEYIKSLNCKKIGINKSELI